MGLTVNCPVPVLNTAPLVTCPILKKPVELAAALVRQTNQPATVKQTVKGLYQGILKIQPVDTNLLQLALGLAADLRLKGADAIYVALAHQLGVPLVSWDKEQLQRSSGLIEAYTPGNYPF